MSIYELEGYTYDGAVYCLDCCDAEPEQWPDTGYGPNPALGSDLQIGDACDHCRKVWTSEGWEPLQDVLDPTLYRWAVCRECNGKVPVSKGWGYSTLRSQALRGRLECENCAQPTMHF